VAAAAGFLASAWLHSPVGVVLALSVAAAGLLSSHGPFWQLPSSFLSGSAAAGGIALIVSIANVAGFLGPYATGVLRGVSGSYSLGLVALALVSLAGAGLAVWLRQAPQLAPLGSEQGETARTATESR
jgi:hypothetical protein